MGERVTAIVNNPEHPLGGEFARFARYVQETCENILNGVPVSRGSGEKRKKKGPESGYVLIENDGTLQEEYLTPLEKLCEGMKVHFEHVAQLFLEQFNSLQSEVLKRKLQLCYEEIFYNEVGRDVIKVYEKAYERHKEKLIHDLGFLSSYPINCLDLGMKNEWWLELFEKRRQVTVARRRSENKPIPPLTRSRHHSDSITPPESDSSSGNSSPSPSSHGSSNGHECTDTSRHESKKHSSDSLRSKFIGFIRRKSREVSEAESEVYGGNKNDTRNSFSGNKMSGAVKEVFIPNTTNNNVQHEPYIQIAKDNNSIAGNFFNEREKTIESHQPQEDTPPYEKELSKFSKYFGPSLDSLKQMFEIPSVFGKMKCLTKCLTEMTNSVQELRQDVLGRGDESTQFSLAITADDLLPLMVLIILQMDSNDAASIAVELKMMQDLIPRFLNMGCHGWALVEFDMASKVLQSLCSQFDWSASFSPSS